MSLAQSNKSRAGAKATKEREALPAARRNFLGTANWRDPVGGQRCRSSPAARIPHQMSQAQAKHTGEMIFQKFITVFIVTAAILLRPGSRSHRFSARAPGPASSTCR
jgi:hypothetical protein